MPLQKPLTGVPDLLGMYQAGQVPADWGGIVTPTIEILKFLQPPEFVNVTGSLTTNAASVGFAIPDRETWLLWMLAATGPTRQTAGNITLTAQVQIGGSVWPIVTSDIAWINGKRMELERQWEKGLLLTGATSLVVTSNNYNTPVPTNLLVGALITRIRT